MAIGKNIITPASLADLPAPPPGKEGWPWTEETPSVRDPASAAERWPRVSIVTPSYNQGIFIEETIRSILLQGYPNLEYFIVDGGSTDGTVEIIRKYEEWLSGWVSEPDRGQSEAINKGWMWATGDILAWLNSDDLYLPGALSYVGSQCLEDTDVDLWYGQYDVIDSKSNLLQKKLVGPTNFATLLESNDIGQPSAFVRKRALDRVGLLDESLSYVMDYELWLRISVTGRLKPLPRSLASFRVHNESKTCSQEARMARESIQIVEKSLASAEDLPGKLLADLPRIMCNKYMDLGIKLWAEGDDSQGTSYMRQMLNESYQIDLDLVGMWIAEKAVLRFDLGATEGVDRLVTQVPQLAGVHQLMQAWCSAFLACRQTDNRQLAFKHCLRAIRNAPRLDIASTVKLPLVRSIVGTRISSRLRSLFLSMKNTH